MDWYNKRIKIKDLESRIAEQKRLIADHELEISQLTKSAETSYNAVRHCDYCNEDKVGVRQIEVFSNRIKGEYVSAWKREYKTFHICENCDKEMGRKGQDRLRNSLKQTLEEEDL